MNIAVAQRKYHEIRILEVRSLTPADMYLLRQKAPPIHEVKTLRDRHHHMAWLVALGKTNLEVAAECRCSPYRVSQHKASPAFQELVAKYTREIENARLEAARDFGARAGRVRDKVEGIIEREVDAIIAGEAATPSLATLNRLSVDRMDRTGYGKHTTSTNINVDFAAKLEAAIQRSTKVIDHEV